MMSLRSLLIVSGILGFQTSSWALPENPILIEGNANFENLPSHLTIQAQDRTILNWQDFSIAEQETVQFILPSSAAAVLNRVIGSNRSELLGQLQSNGQVLLINPNGVLFGKNSVMDVGSLVASTLDVHDRAFLERKELLFGGSSPEKVINEGTIHTRSGDLILIGQNVESHGTLDATDGQAVVLAVKRAALSPSDNGVFFIRTKWDPAQIDNPYAGAFKHGAEPDAIDFPSTSIVTGSISSVSSDGGSVKVFGDWISLEKDAKIDVSGGGEILIGGDQNGESETFSTAKRVFVGNQVQINASAQEKGAGGKVIIWGDEANWFFGSISAQGGRVAGDGGFVEVSSPYDLNFDGLVSTLAPNGKVGTLLLDPLNITIGAATDAATTTTPAGAFFTLAFPNAAGATLGAAALVTALGSNSVKVTTNGTVGAAPGNISVTSSVNWSSGTILTLDTSQTPSGSIIITADIQETSAGNTGGVVLIAPTGGAITLGPAPGIGAAVGSQNGITFVGDPTITRCSRSRPTLTLNGSANIDVRLGFVPTLALTTATGPIDVTCGTINLNSLGIAAHNSAAIGHGNVVIGFNTLNTTATATITVDSSGNINMNNTGSDSLIAIGHGNFDQQFSAQTIAGDVCVTAAGAINMTALSAPPSGNFQRMQIGHGTNRFSSLSYHANITVRSGGDIVMNSANDNPIAIGFAPDQGATSVTGDVNVFSGGNCRMSTNGTNSMCFIGYGGEQAPLLPVLNGNVTLSTGGSLVVFMNNAHTVRSAVGSTVNITSITGNVQVAIGNNLIFNSVNPQDNTSAFWIGFRPNLPGASAQNTYLAVGNSVTMSSAILAGNSTPFVIQAPNDVNMGVFGTITLSGAGNAANPDFVSSWNAAGGTTRMWAGSNIIVTPAANMFIGEIPPGTAGHSVDIRAGNSINLAPSLKVTTGPLFESVNTIFGSGDLWTGSATQLLMVDKQTLPNPFSLAPITPTLCSTCTACTLPLCPPTCFPPCSPCACNPPAFGLASSSTKVGGSGGGTLVTPAVTSTTGQISLFSTCGDDNGIILDTVAHPGSSYTHITTMSGNIVVSNFLDITNLQTLVTLAPGSILLNACRNVMVDNSVNAGTSVTLNGGNNVFINANVTAGTTCQTCAAAGSTTVAPNVTILGTTQLLMVSGLNMTIQANDLLQSTGGNVTLVIDNQFPCPATNICAANAGCCLSPRYGGSTPGSTQTFFTIDPTANVLAAGGLRIFSSVQLNTTIPSFTLNNAPFSKGAEFTNTNAEIWCTYYPGTCGNSNLVINGVVFPGGSPFTIFYKNCLQVAMQQATIIVDQFLVDLHPYNEFPGWVSRFTLGYKPNFNQNIDNLDPIPYYLRRRHLNVINHPKSWTNLVY